MAHLARRYPQDLAVATDDGDRRREHRRQNLFARADQSLERITGASDKRQRRSFGPTSGLYSDSAIEMKPQWCSRLKARLRICQHRPSPIKNETPKSALGDRGPKRRFHRQIPHTETKLHPRNAVVLRGFESSARIGGGDPDWLAGVIGLELRNPCASHVIEIS